MSTLGKSPPPGVLRWAASSEAGAIHASPLPPAPAFQLDRSLPTAAAPRDNSSFHNHAIPKTPTSARSQSRASLTSFVPAAASNAGRQTMLGPPISPRTPRNWKFLRDHVHPGHRTRASAGRRSCRVQRGRSRLRPSSSLPVLNL